MAEIRAHVGYRLYGVHSMYGAFRGGEMIGMAGILRDPTYYGSLLEEDGPWIAIFETEAVSAAVAIRMVKMMARLVRTFPETLLTYCDDRHPTAERLLRIIGFEPTESFRAHWDRTKHRARIWKWPQPL